MLVSEAAARAVLTTLQKTVGIEENWGKYEVGPAGDRLHGEDGEGSD